MKNFDINEAKLGKPVITRSGLPVRIVCFDTKGNMPILALVCVYENDESAYYYQNNGISYVQKDFDLFMKPETKTGWINIYKKDNKYFTVYNEIFNTKEEADDYHSFKRINC